MSSSKFWNMFGTQHITHTHTERCETCWVCDLFPHCSSNSEWRISDLATWKNIKIVQKEREPRSRLKNKRTLRKSLFACAIRTKDTFILAVWRWKHPDHRITPRDLHKEPSGTRSPSFHCDSRTRSHARTHAHTRCLHGTTCSGRRPK